MGSLVQPIPYQGSKRKIAREILRHFPVETRQFVEPFAGSGAMSIAMAQSGRARKFWVNDAHPALMALWREIIERPSQLSDAYSELWFEQIGQEREFFNLVRDRFNRHQSPVDFLYLLARCVKASVRYNSKGEFNNTPDNRRKGARPSEMRRRIERTSELLSTKAYLTCLDYKQVLADCEQDDLVYMDPPYQGVRGRRDKRYLPDFEEAEFHAALKELNHRDIPFAVSYDGRTGDRLYGAPLPQDLGLQRLELQVGRSTQSTLLGRNEVTYESLYLIAGSGRCSPFVCTSSGFSLGCRA